MNGFDCPYLPAGWERRCITVRAASVARASRVPAMVASVIPAAYSLASCHSNAEAGMIGTESMIPTTASMAATARIPVGASVAVVGLGGVGLMSLLAARASSARQVIAIDMIDDKLKLAKQLGATHTVNAKDKDAVEQVRALSGGGVEYAFEMASSVRALELAYKVTRRGGTTVTGSLPHPSHRFELPATNLVAEERTLKGSYIGSCVPARDIPRFISLYQQGLLPVDRLMSERIRLDDINEGFDRLADGASVRQILVP